MDIIEKQVEKIKEVPYGYWDNCGNVNCAPYSWNRGCNINGINGLPASRGLAGAGLGLK